MKTSEKIGEYFGFALSYIIFSTMFFFVLRITGKDVEMPILFATTAVVVAIGMILKRYLR